MVSMKYTNILMTIQWKHWNGFPHSYTDGTRYYKNKCRVKGTVSEGLVWPDCDMGEILTQSHCLTGLDLAVFFRKLLVERAKVKGLQF
jgi:hypothetical protein